MAHARTSITVSPRSFMAAALTQQPDHMRLLSLVSLPTTSRNEMQLTSFGTDGRMKKIKRAYEDSRATNRLDKINTELQDVQVRWLSKLTTRIAHYQ